jgi:DoxX-like family
MTGWLAIAPFDFATLATWLRVGIAIVWLVFGFVFKILNKLPRHREIVARVLGARWAAPVTILVGVGECGLGLWMLSGRFLVPCVALQTAAILTMNVLEIRRARDLLLTPWGMVAANTALLTAAWYVALTVR